MRIAIVGAGLVGLVAALRLSRAGHRITVFERDTLPGGLVASFKPSPTGDPVERFYHHVFRSDAAFIRLVEELGLSANLRWSSVRTVCWYDGLHRLDSVRSLLAFRPLSTADRLRVAVALGLLRLSPSAKPFEDIVAATWLRSVMGTRAFAALFAPLFDAKFGPYSRRISLAWFWARIRDRTVKLGYLDGGFSRVYDSLVRAAEGFGTTFRFSTAVRRISPQGDRFLIETQLPQSGDDSFDQVLVTLPLSILSSLAPDLPSSYVAQYGATPLLAARTIVLALDRPLTDAYWINVCEPGVPFSVVVEQTNMVDAGRFGGRHIVYVGNYAPSFERRPVDDVLREFEPYLKRINPNFEMAWILESWQFIAPAAQPVIEPGHGRRIPAIATPLRGLFNASIEQTYPHDRGQNYAISVAETAASQMLEQGGNSDQQTSRRARRPASGVPRER